MEEFMLGLYVSVGIAVGIASVAALLYSVILLINFLAKRNLFFTIVQEGKAKAVKKWGEFHKLIIVYKDHAFDQDWNVRHASLADEEAEDFWDDKTQGFVKKQVELQIQKPLFGGLLGKIIGKVFWIGIPPIYTIHEYTFRWLGLRQRARKELGREGELVEQVVDREEQLDFILLQDDTYFTFIKRAETRGKGMLVPIDVEVILTIRIVNPYKALFRVQDWLEVTLNQLIPVVRGFVSSREYETVISGLEEGKPKPERDESMEPEARKKDPLLAGIAHYVLTRYGVLIKKVGIGSVTPPEEVATAGIKKWGAEREKERIQAVYQTIADFGDTGLLVRTLEAVESAGNKQGNWVIPLGLSPQSILESIRGRKKEEVEK
ncbi:MAG: hypothetical protein HYT13_00730 [Candidatus Liptonbacteria bacterium]|nr:hypothetical protein [Candidatus Liptonbacteria bacterium]